MIVYLKLILSIEKGDTVKYKSSPLLFTLQFTLSSLILLYSLRKLYAN